VNKLTKEKTAAIIEALCTSRKNASCTKGFRYQGVFNDLRLLVLRKLALLLVVTCEYTLGVPVMDLVPGMSCFLYI